ncbi:hypothetical protein MML48_3g00000995 [Holotrichia oblita]|uniref:Uncharacterized protein n=1 Tax=Holotrichia oblita TaxID=644536 RepID=A0ACB9THV5_HOLOL|nr:hypothetical protein MML48_3g00000995 [Holotrichia oblita]
MMWQILLNCHIDLIWQNSLNDKHSFRPSRVFNADEAGVSFVHENNKLITIKGKLQVGKMTSGERGRNVTLMFCMSAIELPFQQPTGGCPLLWMKANPGARINDYTDIDFMGSALTNVENQPTTTAEVADVSATKPPQPPANE